MLSLVLATVAVAAEEPCYGHAWENRLEGEHFWVEWEPWSVSGVGARDILEAAEAARRVYVEDLGYRFTERAVVISVLAQGGGGIGGQTQTRLCDGEHVPRIELYVGTYETDRARGVAAHEVAHGVQYAYMGDFMDSVESWLWFMEGHATWLTVHADGNVTEWADSAAAYLAHPELALHHGLAAFLVDEQSRHMYGTAHLVRFLDVSSGGPDTVRAFWEWGAGHTGTPIFFPDAVAGVGLDFGPLWASYLAISAVSDLPWAEELPAPASRIAEVARLPAAGGPEDELRPQGMGFSVVRFAPEAGKRGQALEVRFSGDPAVPWHAVLVRADGDGPGSTVLDYVSVPITAGEGTGWLSDFDGREHAFLVVSPESRSLEAFDWSFEAALVRDPGPMEGTVVLRERPGGCTHAQAGPSALLVLLAAAASRRGSTTRRPQATSPAS